MIYINDRGEIIELKRLDYISEREYYTKVKEMYDFYISVNKDSASNKPRLDNLEAINNLIQTFHVQNQ